jgi:PHD/YefM family antitoxin component YafN of YafNO toxin-antitoxin module
MRKFFLLDKKTAVGQQTIIAFNNSKTVIWIAASNYESAIDGTNEIGPRNGEPLIESLAKITTQGRLNSKQQGEYE